MTATTPVQSFSSENKGAWPAILAAGLTCSVLDISAAFTNAYLAAGMTPGRVLQAVASGLLGRNSFELGVGAMVFGLALHFAVAFAWAILFYALSRKFPMLVRQAVISGLIYGAVVYVLMNVAVLPLASLFRSFYLDSTPTFAPKLAWAQFCIHLAFVGLPIALMVRKYSR